MKKIIKIENEKKYEKDYEEEIIKKYSSMCKL